MNSNIMLFTYYLVLDIYLRFEFPLFNFLSSFKYFNSISLSFLDVNKYDETLN